MVRETGPRPRFWWTDAPGPAAFMLAPLGGLYARLMAARAASYARGRRKVFRPPAACVSVGNLTVGGTGKTPCVRYLAERLTALGRRPVVISRGYGARVGASGLDEEGAALARAVPGLEIDQSRRRREGAGDWSAVAADPSVVILLDDGFQKLVAARDLDVVLIDATRPFGNGRCMPAGPMREPLSALGRSDVVLLTRADQAAPASVRSLAELVRRTAPDALLLRARHAPSRLLISGTPPEALRGRRVQILSAIAHPSAFAATAAALGADVRGRLDYRDHAPLGRRAWEAARAAALACGADLVLCTSKDLPKLEEFAADAGPGPALEALDVVMELMDDPAPLFARLRALPRGAPEPS